MKGVLFVEQKVDLWETWASTMPLSSGPGHTLIPVAGVDSRAVPRVHSTVHTGHGGRVHVGEFARLLCWRGVLLHVAQVTQVAGNGEFLGT